MGIWAIIIVNIIIVLCLVIGFFTGRGNRFWLQLIKLICYSGVSIGLFFLTPLVVGKLPQSVVVDLIPGWKAGISLIAFTAMFIVCWLTIFGALIPLKRKMNRAATEKAEENMIIKAQKEDAFIINERKRRSRRDRKIQRKEEFKRTHKVSRLLGGILGVITALILIFILMLPVKYLANDWYKGSIVGVSDKVSKGTEKLEEEWEKKINRPEDGIEDPVEEPIEDNEETDQEETDEEI